jgi:peptide/nickel transport system substrate-binding protein
MTRRPLLLTVLAALVLPGCGISIGPKPVTAPTPLPGATTGGVLRVGVTAPRTVDPGLAADATSRLIVRTMCDTLVTVDPKTGLITPGLARKWTVTTDTHDNTQIVFALRKGLHFTDGSTLNAKSVTASLARIAQERFASPEAYLLHDVDGYRVARNRSQFDKPPKEGLLLGVVPTDAYGVAVTLVLRNGAALRSYADPATAIVSPKDVHATSGGRESFEPHCIGPYRLSGPWKPTDRLIVLDRNRDYVGNNPAFSHNGKAWADRIEFHVYPTIAAAAAAYRAGQVDVAPFGLSDRPAQVAAGDVVEGNGDFLQFIGVPLGPGSPFINPLTRLALSNALDRRLINERVYGGGRQVATSFLPPSLGPEYTANPCAKSPFPLTPEAHIQRARAELQALRVDLSTTTTKLYYYDKAPGDAALVAEVARQWHEAVGLTAVPTPLTKEQFTAQFLEVATIDGAFSTGWSYPVDAGVDWLYTMYSNEGLGAGNIAGFTDKRFEIFLRRKVLPRSDGSDAAGDQKERAIWVAKAQTELCELMPVIPIAFSKSHWLVRGSVLGSARDFVLDVHGDPVLRELYARG